MHTVNIQFEVKHQVIDVCTNGTIYYDQGGKMQPHFRCFFFFAPSYNYHKNLCFVFFSHAFLRVFGFFFSPLPVNGFMKMGKTLIIAHHWSVSCCFWRRLCYFTPVGLTCVFWSRPCCGNLGVSMTCVFHLNRVCSLQSSPGTRCLLVCVCAQVGLCASEKTTEKYKCARPRQLDPPLA